MDIHICNTKTIVPKGGIEIDTTSRSKHAWSKQLSPFFLGPIELYGGMTSKNMENAWQFSKVYKCHLNDLGLPTYEYTNWALKGWESKFAYRYPMGRGAKPEYSFWDGKIYTYIEARKKIYAPLYAKAVRETDAFKRLQTMVNAGLSIWLRDFDGYDHKALGMSYQDVINCESRKMGHAFVLGMMLENQEVWRG